MNAAELKALVHNEFDSVPPPAVDILVRNCGPGCYETAKKALDRIDRGFYIELLDELCAEHIYCLSAQAFQFFYPILMIASLDYPDSETALTAINLITGKPQYITERFSHFSLPQRRTINAYLRFVQDQDFLWALTKTQRHFEARLAFWDDFTRQ
jgi:hypothetical protein